MGRLNSRLTVKSYVSDEGVGGSNPLVERSNFQKIGKMRREITIIDLKINMGKIHYFFLHVGKQ